MTPRMVVAPFLQPQPGDGAWIRMAEQSGPIPVFVVGPAHISK